MLIKCSSTPSLPSCTCLSDCSVTSWQVLKTKCAFTIDSFYTSNQPNELFGNWSKNNSTLFSPSSLGCLSTETNNWVVVRLLKICACTSLIWWNCPPSFFLQWKKNTMATLLILVKCCSGCCMKCQCQTTSARESMKHWRHRGFTASEFIF